MYGVAYRLLGVAADAEDVTQEVFVGLPRALASYRGDGSFEGWLRRVAARYALMHLRRVTRRSESPLEHAGDPPRAGSDQLDDVIFAEAVARLEPGLRAVFVLKDVEGFSHSEIAELLGISPAASAVRLFRARKQLRHELGNP